MKFETTVVYENQDEKTLLIKLLDLEGVKPSEVTVEAKIAGNLESKTALAILHGAHLNHHFMEILTPWFDDMKLIYFSAPGRLGSSPVEELTGNAYATVFSRAFACLQEMGEFDSLSILGYSMGGYLGTKIATMGEVTLDRLIYFFSAAGGPTGIDDVTAFVTANPEKGLDPEVLGCIAVIGFAPGTSEEYKGMVASTMPTCFAPPVSMINDMIELGKTEYLPLLEELPAGMRFMFVMGADDQVIPNETSQTTADKLGELGFDVTVLVVPDCGHVDFCRKLHNDLMTGERGIASHIREFLSA